MPPDNGDKNKVPPELVYLEIHTRLTKVEGALSHVQAEMKENRNVSAHEIAGVHDKIDEVVAAQARSEHELSQEFRSGIDKTNSRVEQMVELLNKINGKLSIHQFIFGALAAIALAFIGALFKAAVESFIK